ncbi:MAG: hypothetical protein ABIN91_23225 [Mucilaginibacter sp.]|uniref:hypothetical protein n=1 Tax=Mucilaginibacter sp. TaxID=1882438 RepID=UPI003265E6F0
MKRTLFKILPLLIIGFPIATNAQVAPEIMKRFSGSVVSRVYSVTSKVSISAQKQLLLADSFKQQDSLADAALTKGLSAAEVSKNYQNTQEIYSRILSPLELKDYLDADNYLLDALSKAVKYRKELNLNAEQTADLLKVEQTKKQLTDNSGFDAKKFENSNLIRILDKKYKPFLLIKNRDRAIHETEENWKQLKKLNLTKGLDSASVTGQMKGYINNRYAELEYAFDTGNQEKVNALQRKLDAEKPKILLKLKASKSTADNWAQLKKFNLTQNLDSANVCSQNFDYELAKLITIDKFPKNFSRQQTDSVLRKLQMSEPVILLKLDAYNGRLPGSLFADVVKYRTQITLLDNQIDTLVTKVIALEQLKIDNKAHQIFDNSNIKEFEVKNLLKVLSPRQYDFYLYYKVGDRARTQAYKDWEKLKEMKLTEGLDSIKVNKEILEYEHRLYVAKERVFNEKSRENSFRLQQIENSKPSILQDLQTTLKNLAATNEVKKSFSW